MWKSSFFVVCLLAHAKAQNAEGSNEFVPVVTATCKTGVMSIRIHFNQPFYGIAHAKEYRTDACMAQGNGTESINFDVNLMAPQGAPDYCGVLVNNRVQERSLPLAVRVHRTLELADDKFYVITCGKGNLRNETSLVSLRIINENGEKVTNTAYGLPYTLHAELSKPDGTHGIKLKNCFAFNMKNDTVQLLDGKGCAMHNGVSTPKHDLGSADMLIASMFRFHNSSQANFQCTVVKCRGSCPIPDCTSDSDGDTSSSEEYVGAASTGVFVLDPSAIKMSCNDGRIHPPWLLYLAIALGVMFLVMLLINCFLCTAMTCSCARTDVIEKDPSVVEDYDPYRSWHGSQYGSRYPSSTIHSTRSVSDNSDHYAIVQSRPGSRHSGAHRNRH